MFIKMGSIGRLSGGEAHSNRCYGQVTAFVILGVQWFLCSLLIPECSANFNLYLNTDEVKRTLGLSKELYYVTEGVPNTYALNFVVPVPATVNALHFTWKTLGQKPLPYSASVDISDPITLEKPVLDIPWNGTIPTETETFTVYMLCTGKRSDEVFVELTINVTADPKFRVNEVTTIVLKRKKVCLEGNADKMPTIPLSSNSGGTSGSSHHRGHTQSATQHHTPHHKNNPGSNSRQNKGGGSGSGGVASVGVARNGMNAKIGLTDEVVMISTAEEASPDVSSIIYIVGGCTLGLMVILLAVLAAAYVRARKGNRTAESRGFLHVDTSGTGKDTSLSSGTGTASASGGSLFVRPESPHHYSSVSPCLGSGSYTYSSFQPNAHYTEISNSTIDSNSCKLAEMTIERCKVRLQSIILEGTFAKIYKGTVLERDGSEEKVVVKTVIDHSSPVQMTLLLHEGLALVGMVHKHVYTVIGVAAEERVPPFLIYPDDGFRNLKRFLQRCRSGPGRPITTQEIVHMAIQIAGGIAFLHRQNVFHRDVAARNCV
ncbi:unnamed protein product [Orchesella dallaii]